MSIIEIILACVIGVIILGAIICVQVLVNRMDKENEELLEKIRNRTLFDEEES